MIARSNTKGKPYLVIRRCSSAMREFKHLQAVLRMGKLYPYRKVLERCWRGKPAQMIMVSGFGVADSTIPATVGAAKLYREHLEGRLRKNSYVLQKQETPSREHRNFITALAVGGDYRASLTMFLSSPLSDQQLAKERRHAEGSGLAFAVTNTVTREDIEDAAPPALTIHIGVGTTGSTK